MSKRILDADALLEWIYNSNSMLELTLGITKKINELATPVEPQQIIFDADGWGSMYDVPKNIEIEVMVNNNTIIKAKFDADLNICTDYDVNKIKVLNKWRPLPTLPKEA